ncbi:MAG: Ig-like domain-containing protein [Flavobacteriaceae bacterium]
MDVIRPIKSLKKIKYSLVFFCALLLSIQCKRQKKGGDFELSYQDGKAVAFSIPWEQDSAALQVFLSGEGETPVLGTQTTGDGRYTFKPIVPFLAGQTYELRKKNELLATFTVEHKRGPAPELLAIYPSRDTVPENLLKIYLQFSQPMQEVGEVLNFINVHDLTKAEDVSVFLKLESELWNKTHDRLTLWLDPGRIKTDLIPNREQGLPLNDGHSYTIHISDQWKNAQGIPLSKAYEKQLYVVGRDSKKPNVEAAELEVPKSGTKTPLRLDFKEAMDAVLMRESFHLQSGEGIKVGGEFTVGPREESVYFIPLKAWKKRDYEILIDAKLEDLAGNNLNNLFDTNLEEQLKSNPKTSIKSRTFTID